MISLHGVSKSFDGGTSFVVRDLSLDIKEGELLVLLGPSGCGKTTTLKMINRLEEPTSGEIRVGDRDVRDQDPVQLRRSIGYVIQSIGLFPHMTVAENVGLVPGLLSWERADISKRVHELLELVGLTPSEFRDRPPRELSGGQKQRVGVARALAARPTVMLMDEPFGALDPLTRDTLRDEYANIHRKLGLTTVLVTHDMAEALLLADRIAVLKDGAVLRLGTPRELMADPQDDYVRTLMESPLKQARKISNL